MNSATAESSTQQVRRQTRIEDPYRNSDALSHAAAAFSFSGEDCEAVGGTERGGSANVTAERGEVCECVRACGGVWRTDDRGTVGC